MDARIALIGQMERTIVVSVVLALSLLCIVHILRLCMSRKKGNEKMANEKRLIDANALTKLMCRACNNECCEEPCEPGECFIYDAVNNAPTVDAVEVVRCKDCKCAKPPRNTKYVGTYVRCALYDPAPMMRCDDFCSYGERREGE